MADKVDLYLQPETHGCDTWRRIRNTNDKPPAFVVPLASNSFYILLWGAFLTSHKGSSERMPIPVIPGWNCDTKERQNTNLRIGRIPIRNAELLSSSDLSFDNHQSYELNVFFKVGSDMIGKKLCCCYWLKYLLININKSNIAVMAMSQRTFVFSIQRPQDVLGIGSFSFFHARISKADIGTNSDF